MKAINIAIPEELRESKMTAKQKWAQKRNFAKMRLRGVLAALDSLSQDLILTEKERMYLTESNAFVKPVVRDWDRFNPRSRKEYLERQGADGKL